jgi:[ribosomal protein S5]-alanine N-acetyltransferase
MSAEFEGLSLRLRRPRASDLPFLSVMFSDPLVMRFSDHGPRPLSFGNEWLKAAADCERHSSRWIAALREDDTPIGVVSLDAPQQWFQEQGVQLGYRLTPTLWGKGLGSETAELALVAARALPHSQRVVATVDPANVASIKILKKIGMIFEREVMGPGYDHPDHLYATAV